MRQLKLVVHVFVLLTREEYYMVSREKKGITSRSVLESFVFEKCTKDEGSSWLTHITY